MGIQEEKTKRKKKKKAADSAKASHSYANADNRYGWNNDDTYKYSVQQEPTYINGYSTDNSCPVGDIDQVVKAPTYEENTIVHKVKEGEGLWPIVRIWFPYMNDIAIAKKANEILIDNRLKSQVLTAGQELSIKVTVEELVQILDWIELNKTNSYMSNMESLQSKLPKGYIEAQNIRAISNKQGQDVRTVYPENITEEEFKKLFFNEHHKYWHLITHGVGVDSNKETVFKPYIAMAELFNGYKGNKSTSDGALVTDEIKKLPLDGALLVFVNACETAINKSPNAHANADGGPDTVGRSMIEAGAQQSISTYWRIDDTNAKVFAENFYNELFKDPKNVDASAALREVQIAMMKAKTTDSFGKQTNKYETKDWAAYQYLSKEYTKEKYGIAGKTEAELKKIQESFSNAESIVELIKQSDEVYVVNIMSASYKTSFNMEKGEFNFKQAATAFNYYVKFNIRIESDVDRYNSIYNVLWEKVSNVLEALNVSTIYLSTSGVYDEINVDSIYDTSCHQFVIEKYHVIKLY